MVTTQNELKTTGNGDRPVARTARGSDQGVGDWLANHRGDLDFQDTSMMSTLETCWNDGVCCVSTERLHGWTDQQFVLEHVIRIATSMLENCPPV